MAYTPITVDQYTTGVSGGEGVFDKMMESMNAHVKAEYDAGRVKGNEYAAVYLGAMQSTMGGALQLLLEKDKTAYEIELLRIQAEKLEIEKDQAAAQLLLINAQIEKMDAEVLLLGTQNANAVLEGLVLVAQECKLRAEFDVLVEQKLKTAQETGLLSQKKITEQAQTNGAGVASDSVIGKQIALYDAQSNGFIRDAEQKAAKLLIDSWSVRRTTDEATLMNVENQLLDANVGRAVTKLLSGVNA